MPRRAAPARTNAPEERTAPTHQGDQNRRARNHAKIIKKDQNPVLTHKHIDWHYFNCLLEGNIYLSIPLKTADQLERELNAFTTVIREAVWNDTRVIETKVKGLNMPKEIKHIVHAAGYVRNSDLHRDLGIETAFSFGISVGLVTL
jgi:adenylate cyclase